MAAKKKEESEAKVKGTKEILAEGLKSGKEFHYNFDSPRSDIISTGSMILDSEVKVRAGSTVRLQGQGAELGKTSQCLVFAANYMATMPNSKTFFVAAEARLSPEMMERSGLKFVSKAEDWDYGTVFVLRSNAFGFIADRIKVILQVAREIGEHICTIIDSFDGLILEEDLERPSMSIAQKVAGVPKLTRLFYRHVGNLNWATDGLILGTSQYSQAIKLDPYVKGPVQQGGASGGGGTTHQADYTFLYRERFGKDDILEKPNLPHDRLTNKKLGVYATIEICKSATDVTGTKVRVPIKKGKIGIQIWTEKEIADLIIAYGLIGRSGSWLKFDEDFLLSAKEEGVELIASVQGENKLYEYLEENPEIRNWFKKKLEIYIS